MATVDKVKEALTTTTAPTRFESIETILKRSAAGLGDALPKHMDAKRLNRIVITLLKTSPKLAECDPISVVAAVFQMAQAGLEPLDGQAFIIPYNGKASFQLGYKGLVSLFYRHPLAKSLNCGVVHENDTFEWDRGQGILSHKECLKGDRGAAYAYWIKAELTTGGVITEVMSKDSVIKHAKQHSKTYGSGPWQTDPDAMALKTVFIKAARWMPKSVEMQQALGMDNTIKTKVAADMAEIPDETDWNDGKTIDTPSNAPIAATEAPAASPAKVEPFTAPKAAVSNKPPVNLDDYAQGEDGRMRHKITKELI